MAKADSDILSFKQLKALTVPEGMDNAGQPYWPTFDSVVQMIANTVGNKGFIATMFAEKGTVYSKSERDSGAYADVHAQAYDCLKDLSDQLQSTRNNFDATSTFAVLDKKGKVLGLDKQKIQETLMLGYSYFTDEGYGQEIRKDIVKTYKILGLGELDFVPVQDKDVVAGKMARFVEAVKMEREPHQAAHVYEGTVAPATKGKTK